MIHSPGTIPASHVIGTSPIYKNKLIYSRPTLSHLFYTHRESPGDYMYFMIHGAEPDAAWLNQRHKLSQITVSHKLTTKAHKTIATMTT